MRGKRSDDETAESAVELVRSCAEELSVGSFDVFVSGFAVLDVTILPIDHKKCTFSHKKPSSIEPDGRCVYSFGLITFYYYIWL